MDVGEEFAGEWVSVWANSTPTALGGWVQVSANGTVPASIPSGLVGSHRIAVQDADLQTIGWAPITLVAGGAAPVSGSAPPGSALATPGSATTPVTPARPTAPTTRSTAVDPPAITNTAPGKSGGATAPDKSSPAETATPVEADAVGTDVTGPPVILYWGLALVALVLALGTVLFVRRRRI